MNTALLAKWTDKSKRGDDNLCCSLSRKKHLGQKSIFQIKHRDGFQFWRSLLDIRMWYQRGRCINVRVGH